jgi:serine/threonine protein kinase
MSSTHDEPLMLGRYALYDKIACGGMATVHIGRMTGAVGFTRTCAIKRLHPELARDPDFVTMFLDEARMASRIQHPNVVTILDVVAMQGELFLVMDYVHGEALSTLFKHASERGERVPLPVLTSIMLGTLSGLHAAHEATGEKGEPLHLVHRDVSPQNILVDVDGVARVLDFGVAKAANRLQQTRAGAIKGKPAYMAPEQLAGKNCDRRADIYAAAAVLWEGVCGRRVIDATNEMATMHQVLYGTIESIASFAEDAPRELDDLLQRALARDPDGRLPTALALANELERVVTPASPRQVAAWVRAAAGDDLARRKETLQRIERASSRPSASSAPNGAAAARVSDAGPSVSQADATPSRTSGSLRAHTSSASLTADAASSDAPASKRARGLKWSDATKYSLTLVIALLGAVVLGAGLLVFGKQATARHAAAAKAEPITIAAAPPTTATTAPLVEAPTAPATTASQATLPPLSPAPPPAAPHPSKRVAPSGLGSAAPIANPCASPYYVDERGVKRIKTGCF